MTETLNNIIAPSFCEGEFNELLKKHKETVKLTENNEKRLEAKISRLCSGFVAIFTPFYEIKGTEKFDQIIINMSSFIRRLKSSLRSIQREEDKELFDAYYSFWKKVDKEVKKFAKSTESRYLVNCCNSFSYELEE